MQYFDFKINHVRNIYPNHKLPLEVRLTKRWIVQVYVPEIRFTHDDENINKIHVMADNRFVLETSRYEFKCGFNLLGFGIGVSRKTDEMMELDRKQIVRMTKEKK
jgi:hypothetical protein